MNNRFALVLILSATLLSSCSKVEEEHEFCLNGVWELQKIISPDSTVFHYPDNGLSRLRIYDDTCFYSYLITIAPNGILISPSELNSYTYIYKGEGQNLYLQGIDTHPLMVVDDSTMVIQDFGHKYTWKRCADFDQERRDDIIALIKADAQDNHEVPYRYVFSKAERRLKSTNHALIYLLVSIVAFLLLIASYAHNLFKNKKRVELELKQIEQEREALPVPVREAMNGVEAEFHQSEFYLSIRKRIAKGERLKPADWDMIETQFKSVYPRFCSSLLSLHNMSATEYQVCLLLKLNASPSEIAGVLCKETSSISSIRSRLYHKVFGKKGSSKDWDEFIHSI